MGYEKRFRAAYLELQQVCQEAGWGDPFSYARGKEMFMAIELGHSVADTLSGADAYNQNGEPVEYKSTIGKNISGTYNGISVLPTWEEQVEYLRNKKIGCYANHYVVRYDGSEIVEAYKLSSDAVLMLLLPKIKRQFESPRKGKDPRIGVTLTAKEIITHGEKVL